MSIFLYNSGGLYKRKSDIVNMFYDMDDCRFNPRNVILYLYIFLLGEQLF